MGLSQTEPWTADFHLQVRRGLITVWPVKIVGRRRTSEDSSPVSPAEALARAAVLQEQANRLNPYPRPRGFVFKARTRDEYERWRQAQANPRLW